MFFLRHAVSQIIPILRHLRAAKQGELIIFSIFEWNIHENVDSNGFFFELDPQCALGVGTSSSIPSTSVHRYSNHKQMIWGGDAHPPLLCTLAISYFCLHSHLFLSSNKNWWLFPVLFSSMFYFSAMEFESKSPLSSSTLARWINILCTYNHRPFVCCPLFPVQFHKKRHSHTQTKPLI
jgi:hypothetical protein